MKDKNFCIIRGVLKGLCFSIVGIGLLFLIIVFYRYVNLGCFLFNFFSFFKYVWFNVVLFMLSVFSVFEVCFLIFLRSL